MRNPTVRILAYLTLTLVVMAFAVTAEHRHNQAGNKPYKGKIVRTGMAEPIDGCPAHYVEVK